MGHHTLPLSLGLWLLQHTELPKDSHKPERNVLTELPRDIPKVSRTKNKDQKMIQELNQRPLHCIAWPHKTHELQSGGTGVAPVSCVVVDACWLVIIVVLLLSQLAQKQENCMQMSAIEIMPCHQCEDTALRTTITQAGS